MALDVTRINQQDLSSEQYFKVDCSELKKIIVLHHTAGGPNAKNVVHGWQFNTERVGTAFIIAGRPSSNNESDFKDGEIFQAFGSKYWAYHLAFSKSTNNIPAGYRNVTNENAIAKASIGIEICSWGQLIIDKDGNFRNYVNGIVPKEEVVTLSNPYRGFYHYHAYSKAQLASLKELLTFLCDKYNIPKVFNSNIFDININALGCVPGIYSHTSFRSDKNDVFPQPELIAMLKSL